MYYKRFDTKSISEIGFSKVFCIKHFIYILKMQFYWSLSVYFHPQMRIFPPLKMSWIATNEEKNMTKNCMSNFFLWVEVSFLQEKNNICLVLIEFEIVSLGSLAYILCYIFNIWVYTGAKEWHIEGFLNKWKGGSLRNKSL